MAQNTTIPIPAKAWTELTDAACTIVSFRTEDAAVRIIGTKNGATPVGTAGSIVYPAFTGEIDRTLAKIFPGVLPSAIRIWAYAQTDTHVSISHD